jgi:hypothetical protein
VLQKLGLCVNHKKLRRLMREDNSLAVRRKKCITTTDSRHQFPVFPNLAGWYTPEGANELWVADLTYIRLRGEFVLSGSGSGCVFKACGRLATRANFAHQSSQTGVGASAGRTEAGTGIDPSF